MNFNKSQVKYDNKCDDDDDDDDDDEYGNDEEDDDDDDDDEINGNKNVKKRQSNDVSEGKTIFVRNLSYDTTSDALKELMSQFGVIEYCVLCMNHMTDHSKGSAFVKFTNKCDADECLRKYECGDDNSVFYLEGRQLMVSLAVSRGKVMEIQEKRKSKDRDKRNLYLSKEGVIYPESPAADGVSQTDLAKRLSLEMRKRKMLQNFHYFVSPNRLCIHNLPPEIDDRQLKRLFADAVNDKSAIITEAKVMRDRKKNDKKFGKSKGFGFVAFNEHEYALRSLRYLNNNPNIFTTHKRPIVEFSIENRVALNKKKRRLNPKNESTKNESLDGQRELNDDDSEVQQNQFDFSGLKSRPFKDNETIKPLKMNRKVFEKQKQLKERGKRLTHSVKVKRQKQNNKRNNSEFREQKQKKSKKEFDDFELSHNKKRKNVFDVPMESETKLIRNKNKKRKWFSN